MISDLSRRIAVAAGAELRRLRTRAGLTQAQLAERMGSHHPIIARTEGGHHAVTLDVAAWQAECCGGSIFDVTRAIDRVLFPDAARARAQHAEPLG